MCRCLSICEGWGVGVKGFEKWKEARGEKRGMEVRVAEVEGG